MHLPWRGRALQVTRQEALQRDAARLWQNIVQHTTTHGISCMLMQHELCMQQRKSCMGCEPGTATSYERHLVHHMLALGLTGVPGGPIGSQCMPGSPPPCVGRPGPGLGLQQQSVHEGVMGTLLAALHRSCCSESIWRQQQSMCWTSKPCSTLAGVLHPGRPSASHCSWWQAGQAGRGVAQAASQQPTCPA